MRAQTPNERTLRLEPTETEPEADDDADVAELVEDTVLDDMVHLYEQNEGRRKREMRVEEA